MGHIEYTAQRAHDAELRRQGEVARMAALARAKGNGREEEGEPARRPRRQALLRALRLRTS
jgi:hypothetical protein